MTINWNERWTGNDTPWDLGSAHPQFSRILATLAAQRLTPIGGRAYVPACGRCHEGAMLARTGMTVLGSDIAPAAIEAAQDAYGNIGGLTLKVSDHFAPESDEIGAFDLVFDRAALCAFPPSRQVDFLESSFNRLKSLGLYISIAFSEIAPDVEGPPFALSKAAWDRMCALGTIVLVEDHAGPALTGKILAERSIVVRKRAS